jgi:hypothetical protein
MRPLPLVPEDVRNGAAERRSWHRALTAKVLGKARNAFEQDVLEATWPSDKRAASILRAVSIPSTSASFPLISPTTLLRNLAPASAAMKLFAAGLEVDLGGIYSVAVPHITPPPLAVFVAEGAPAPMLQYSVGKAVVGPLCKILFGVALSRELQEATPSTASGVIGAIMNAQASRSIDFAVFGSTAATSAQPAGLLAGLTPLPPSSQSGFVAIVDDVAALAGAIADANVDPDQMIIVASPKQAVALRLMPEMPYTVLSSLALADKTVCGFAPAAIASAFAEPAIEVSKQAVFHSEDTTPAAIVGGPPAAPAVPTRSAFQTDVIAVRCRAKAAWAVVAPGGAQLIENISW